MNYLDIHGENSISSEFIYATCGDVMIVSMSQPLPPCAILGTTAQAMASRPEYLLLGIMSERIGAFHAVHWDGGSDFTRAVMERFCLRLFALLKQRRLLARPPREIYHEHIVLHLFAPSYGLSSIGRCTGSGWLDEPMTGVDHVLDAGLGNPDTSSNATPGFGGRG